MDIPCHTCGRRSGISHLKRSSYQHHTMLGQSPTAHFYAKFAVPWVWRNEKCCGHGQSALTGGADTEVTTSHQTGVTGAGCDDLQNAGIQDSN